MATLTNIRIQTQSKAVPNVRDITIASVMVVDNTIIAIGGDNTRYVLGVISAENIVVDTPPTHETCGCNTTKSNIFATLIKGVDGVTPDMSDYYDKDVVDEKLAKKQDVISNLDRITAGAALGMTALQSVPSEYVTESELANKGYATTSQVAAKQDKIDDLATIRDGASKGATALQSESYRGTVTGVKANGNTYAPRNGIVDIGTIITEHQDISGKQDKIDDLAEIRSGASKGATALQEHQPLKTINGESLVGEGNIEIEGGIADLEGYATEEYVDNAVAEVNVKGEDGYVYSNGEKVDMRFTRSLIPVGTSIPANANLNTVAYLKVGKYYCSQNVDAKTITNCPSVDAFSMEVFNPLSPVVDNETTAQYVYRLRLLTVYNTGVQYIQYCTVGSTVNKWTYNAWNIIPRSPFTLNSSKKGGSAQLGSATQGVYVSSNGTLTKMTYFLRKDVPSDAVFTDTDTKVTAVANHYAPVEDESVVINAPEGEVIIGLKRDAAGHVVGITTTPMSGGGSSEYESNIEDKTLAMPNAVGGIAKGTTISALEGKTYNEMFDDLLFPTVNPTFTKPTASIEFASYSSTQEVGTTGPTSSNFTVRYNAGAITLNGVKQANRGGTHDTTNSFIYVNGSASNKTLPAKVTLGNTTFNYRAAHAEGPQPKNNKGGDYSSPLEAGTVDSPAITLNGTYPWFASTVGVSTSVVKQPLIAWNNTAGAMYTGDKGFTLEASGTVSQVIKVPNSRTITSMEMYDTGAEKWKAVSLSVWTTSTETITINGANVSYTVYEYNGDARGQVKLRIKF